MENWQFWKVGDVKHIEHMREFVETLQKCNNALFAWMIRFQKLERKYKKLERKYKELEERYYNLDRLFTASMLKRVENEDGKMGILEG